LNGKVGFPEFETILSFAGKIKERKLFSEGIFSVEILKMKKGGFPGPPEK